MKFYYNGTKICESKTHEYKFALITLKPDGTFKRCVQRTAGSKQVLQDEYDRRYRNLCKNLKDWEDAAATKQDAEKIFSESMASECRYLKEHFSEIYKIVSLEMR